MHFLSLICGSTSKSIAARQSLLEKSSVIIHQQSLKPFGYGVGQASIHPWNSMVTIPSELWLQSPRIMNFMSTVDSLLSSDTPMSTWKVVVDRVRDACKKIHDMASDNDLVPFREEVNDEGDLDL
eukprot:2222132-Amphidinium_carterae.1